MKGLFATVFCLFSAAAAIPATTPLEQTHEADPVRILPYRWQWEMLKFHGPGCPDFGSNASYATRPTYGQNTMDGSEIYLWYFAYPGIKAKIGPGVDESETYTWCHTELKYTENDNTYNQEPTANYRLRAHKNGTSIMANYQLDKGVTAEWKFTYYPEDADEVVDEIVIHGPLNNRNSSTLSWFTENSPKPYPKWNLPSCGGGTIRYKTELTITSKTSEGKGTVNSDITDAQSGGTREYGVQQGVSYDWEHCKK
ncbi:uncharacterized protein BP5553_04726 [Venustampulla echinocandica]|uniref:Uncharacterized protein n=1 Tax=Venustampulla echinocandica TaxID=2656787 RepID=A0A370TP36_9HELO|nr:uncharacterized protein BP5553_04726 [Venustampulla echinocandica]RDL37293.1 hypothetical protein BP5553_04726 [Venustampulla echinocandica]